MQTLQIFELEEDKVGSNQAKEAKEDHFKMPLFKKNSRLVPLEEEKETSVPPVSSEDFDSAEMLVSGIIQRSAEDIDELLQFANRCYKEERLNSIGESGSSKESCASQKVERHLERFFKLRRAFAEVKQEVKVDEMQEENDIKKEHKAKSYKRFTSGLKKVFKIAKKEDKTEQQMEVESEEVDLTASCPSPDSVPVCSADLGQTQDCDSALALNKSSQLEEHEQGRCPFKEEDIITDLGSKTGEDGNDTVPEDEEMPSDLTPMGSSQPEKHHEDGLGEIEEDGKKNKESASSSGQDGPAETHLEPEEPAEEINETADDVSTPEEAEFTEDTSSSEKPAVTTLYKKIKKGLKNIFKLTKKEDETEQQMEVESEEVDLTAACPSPDSVPVCFADLGQTQDCDSAMALNKSSQLEEHDQGRCPFKEGDFITDLESKTGEDGNDTVPEDEEMPSDLTPMGSSQSEKRHEDGLGDIEEDGKKNKESASSSGQDGPAETHLEPEEPAEEINETADDVSTPEEAEFTEDTSSSEKPAVTTIYTKIKKGLKNIFKLTKKEDDQTEQQMEVESEGVDLTAACPSPDSVPVCSADLGQTQDCDSAMALNKSSQLEEHEQGRCPFQEGDFITDLESKTGEDGNDMVPENEDKPSDLTPMGSSQPEKRHEDGLGDIEEDGKKNKESASSSGQDGPAETHLEPEEPAEEINETADDVSTPEEAEFTEDTSSSEKPAVTTLYKKIKKGLKNIFKSTKKEDKTEQQMEVESEEVDLTASCPSPDSVPVCSADLGQTQDCDSAMALNKSSQLEEHDQGRCPFKEEDIITDLESKTGEDGNDTVPENEEMPSDLTPMGSSQPEKRHEDGLGDIEEDGKKNETELQMEVESEEVDLTAACPSPDSVPVCSADLGQTQDSDPAALELNQTDPASVPAAGLTGLKKCLQDIIEEFFESLTEEKKRTIHSVSGIDMDVELVEIIREEFSTATGLTIDCIAETSHLFSNLP